MKGFFVLVVVLLLAIACATAQASTIYRVFFDGPPSTPGPDPYVGGPGDILPTGVTGTGLDNPHNIVTPSFAGFEGGNVLDQPLGAAWPNQQGYRFGGDGVRFTETPGPVVANTWTIEAVVRPDLSGCVSDPFLGVKSDVCCILNAENLGDGYGAGDINLSVSQNTGKVSVSLGMGSSYGDMISNTVLQTGQWYHIAVVVRTGNPQRTELWVNGVLDATSNYPAGWEEQNLYVIPGYFNIGSWYWSVQRNWQGEIDAFAISDTALAVGSFVLPTSFPPPLGGQVTLLNYKGDLTTVGMEIQLRPTGSTTPTYTDRVFLDASGNYSMSGALIVTPGVYDVAFKTQSSLRKVVPNVTVPGSVVDVTLVNGDEDGNNQIDAVDRSILSGNFDKAGDQ